MQKFATFQNFSEKKKLHFLRTEIPDNVRRAVVLFLSSSLDSSDSVDEYLLQGRESESSERFPTLFIFYCGKK